MVYNVLQAFRRVAVLARLRLGEPQGYTLSDPEPLRRAVDAPVGGVNAEDQWLFGDTPSVLSPVVAQLSSELDRVSGALGVLRELLDEMARFKPEIAVPVNSLHVPIVAGDEAFLFDGEATSSVASGVLSAADDAVFLFEETDHPVHISVFDSPLQDKRLAA